MERGAQRLERSLNPMPAPLTKLILLPIVKATVGGRMLSVDDNKLITQVGPGTPMGEVFRRYWIPALMSSEVPTPDCPPVKVRLLGEDLVAFRATSGEVGL